MESILVDAIGHRVRIVFGPSLDDDARNTLAEGWQDAVLRDASDDPHAIITASLGERLYGDSDVSAPTLPELASALTVQVTLRALELAQGQMLLLHACGVATDDGDVLAFIGPSGRGKTTASRALGAHLRYLSDESVGIRPDLSVVSYRKPLSIIETVGEVKQQRAPSSLGMRPLGDGPFRLAALVLLDRTEDGPLVPEVSTETLADAVAELVPQTSYLGFIDGPLASLADLVERTGGIRRVRYRESERLIEAIPALLAARPTQAEVWSSYSVPAGHDQPAAPDEGPTDLTADTAIGWGAISDAIAVDGQPVVLHNQTVHVLDGLGPLVWELTRTGATVQQIADAAVAEFGAPPEGVDPLTVASAAVADILRTGMLVRA